MSFQSWCTPLRMRKLKARVVTINWILWTEGGIVSKLPISFLHTTAIPNLSVQSCFLTPWKYLGQSIAFQMLLSFQVFPKSGYIQVKLQFLVQIKMSPLPKSCLNLGLQSMMNELWFALLAPVPPLSLSLLQGRGKEWVDCEHFTALCDYLLAVKCLLWRHISKS